MQIANILIFLLGFIIAIIFTTLRELIYINRPFLRKYFCEDKKIIFGFRVHYTIIGLLLMIVSIATYSQTMFSFFTLGLGIGIILCRMYIDNRLVFWERSK